MRSLGPEGPNADPHGVVPGHLASYPVDNTGVAGGAGSHTVAPLPPVATPFGALVVHDAVGRLLTVREVADRLRVSRATVYRLVQAGALARVEGLELHPHSGPGARRRTPPRRPDSITQRERHFPGFPMNLTDLAGDSTSPNSLDFLPCVVIHGERSIDATRLVPLRAAAAHLRHMTSPNFYPAEK